MSKKMVLGLPLDRRIVSGFYQFLGFLYAKKIRANSSENQSELIISKRAQQVRILNMPIYECSQLRNKYFFKATIGNSVEWKKTCSLNKW